MSITFAHSIPLGYARLSAPAVVVTDATKVNVTPTGSIRVRQGAGTVTVRPDTANGPVVMDTTDTAAVVGSSDQRGGILAAGATFSAELGRFRGSTLPVSLAAGGAAVLAGASVLVPDRNTSTFSSVTLAPGYALSCTATQALVTYTG